MAFFFSITETNCCPIKITWSSWLSSFWEKKGKSAPKIVQCVLDLSLFLCLDFPEGYKEKKKVLMLRRDSPAGRAFLWPMQGT